MKSTEENGLCGSWDGDNTEKWMKTIFGPEWTMPDRAVLLVIVCVYDQNYALVIVTQPKKEECEIRFDMKTQF